MPQILTKRLGWVGEEDNHHKKKKRLQKFTRYAIDSLIKLKLTPFSADLHWAWFLWSMHAFWLLIVDVLD